MRILEISSLFFLEAQPVLIDLDLVSMCLHILTLGREDQVSVIHVLSGNRYHHRVLSLFLYEFLHGFFFQFCLRVSRNLR